MFLNASISSFLTAFPEQPNNYIHGTATGRQWC